MNLVPLSSFERTFKKLDTHERASVISTLRVFSAYLSGAQKTIGLGFKKINCDKYELRADIRVRIVLKRIEDTYYLIMVGNHDDVVRYLKEYRHR